MTRRRRIFVPGYPMHVVQRGNDRRTIFLDDHDRTRYLDFLVEAAEQHECAIHCYVLMGNHVHLLLTPENADALPRTMQSVGIRYVRYFNTAHERTGGLWEGRYRASLVNTDRYLQACYRYIELNPVRANLIADPAEWPWSSHRRHAFGEPDRVVSVHQYYDDLADSAESRSSRYRKWFRDALTEHELEKIRETTRQELVLGDDAFKNQIESQLPFPARPGRRGRKKIGV
ncbi:MAG: transposase [Gammaproteobacteria bacterium]|nr:transposase [Gammaproteobacteria bacterium]